MRAGAWSLRDRAPARPTSTKNTGLERQHIPEGMCDSPRQRVHTSTVPFPRRPMTRRSSLGRVCGAQAFARLLPNVLPPEAGLRSQPGAGPASPDLLGQCIRLGKTVFVLRTPRQPGVKEALPSARTVSAAHPPLGADVNTSRVSLSSRCQNRSGKAGTRTASPSGDTVSATAHSPHECAKAPPGSLEGAPGSGLSLISWKQLKHSGGSRRT